VPAVVITRTASDPRGCQKGAAVARLRSRFRITGLEEIDPDLHLEELVHATPFRYRRHVGYRALPDQTAREVLATLRHLRPQLCEPLSLFQEQVRRAQPAEVTPVRR